MTRNRAQHASLVEEPVPVFFLEISMTLYSFEIIIIC